MKKFYIEVVSGIYKVDVCFKTRRKYNEQNNGKILALQLGDTRHLAICNLIMQGYNPLTIAELAYHDSVKSQLHYTQYIRKYAKSYTIELSNKLSRAFSKIQNLPLANVSQYIKANLNKEKAEITLSQKNGSIINSFGDVCTNKLRPMGCRRNCFSCPHHIPVVNAQNKDDVQRIIDSERESAMIDFDVSISVLESIITSIAKASVKLSNNKYVGNVILEERYQTEINKTIGITNRLAKVEAVQSLIDELGYLDTQFTINEGGVISE